MQRYIAFLKVVEQGNFTAAAEMLGYSQSAVSKMLQSLEQELGVQLLSRSRYGIRLTPEGDRLLPSIRSAVAQFETVQAIAGEIHGLETGLIRIGAFTSISNHWLVPAIDAFWKEHPNVRFDLVQGDYSSISEQVRDGELDFGFVNRAAGQGLSIRPFKSDEFHVALPAGHSLAELPKIPLSALEGEPFLMLRAGVSDAYNEAREVFRLAGIEFDARLEAHDDYTILSMVERGLGVTISPLKNIEFARLNIVSRPLDPPLIRELCIITRDPATLSFAARSFIRFMEEMSDQLP